jgi:hypothetical protein
MVRYAIRDVLWLTVVVALAVGWWVDNKRIEKAVISVEQDRRQLAQDRRELEADYQDRLAILDEAQKNVAKGLLPRPGRVKALQEAAASRAAEERQQKKSN